MPKSLKLEVGRCCLRGRFLSVLLVAAMILALVPNIYSQPSIQGRESRSSTTFSTKARTTQTAHLKQVFVDVEAEGTASSLTIMSGTINAPCANFTFTGSGSLDLANQGLSFSGTVTTDSGVVGSAVSIEADTSLGYITNATWICPAPPTGGQQPTTAVPSAVAWWGSGFVTIEIISYTNGDVFIGLHGTLTNAVPLG